MTYKLWIDDKKEIDQTLTNYNKDWKVAKSSEEAISIVKKNGAPYFISFDYDLGDGDDIMPFLKWLAKSYASGKVKLEPRFDYYVHNMTAFARAKIYDFMEGLLESYPLEPLKP